MDTLIARTVNSAKSTRRSLFYSDLTGTALPLSLVHHHSLNDHDTTDPSSTPPRTMPCMTQHSPPISPLNMVDITLDVDISAAREAGREEEEGKVVRDCGKDAY
ncbi:hypothetical protein APHAL10511_001456 [Amanita phalloides]|nr:hypothetical protein APHAL10511_001456 [Amanita phalloides]